MYVEVQNLSEYL